MVVDAIKSFLIFWVHSRAVAFTVFPFLNSAILFLQLRFFISSARGRVIRLYLLFMASGCVSRYNELPLVAVVPPRILSPIKQKDTTTAACTVANFKCNYCIGILSNRF